MSAPHVSLLTREYPPEVYGGAGVHVEYLAKALAEGGQVDVEVLCFGRQRDDPLVGGAYQPWDQLPSDPVGKTLGYLSVDLRFAAGLAEADLVHSHTWYANLGGHLGKIAQGIPHVLTCHSLEPLRPWKAEQLAGGYNLSSWVEKTAIEAADAVIAVSSGMRDDVLRVYPEVDPSRVEVIYNGIDTAAYAKVTASDVLERYGVDKDRPYVMFVGRVTRQKGIEHLLDAARHFDPEAALVLCAGAADTPELGASVDAKVAELKATRSGVHLISEMLPREQLVQLLSHAAVFVCPSVYEPFGLINVEAMACELPVVASAVGGIPEIVVQGETGYLVQFTPGDDPYGTPADPQRFARDLATAVNRLIADPSSAQAMGRAGRRRVVEVFDWSTIARQTTDLYLRLLADS